MPGSASAGAVPPEQRASRVDGTLVDEILRRTALLPEPVARCRMRIERARTEHDATGTCLALCDLGMGVVRYATSAALAALAQSLGPQIAPPPLASALRRVIRMTDGHWCSLGRTVVRELAPRDTAFTRMLGFLDGKAVTNLVRSRNALAHGRSSGDDTPERTLAVLESARDLLALPLLVAARGSSGAFEWRVGYPGPDRPWPVWKGDPPPDGLEGGVLAVSGGWLRLGPWLPETRTGLWLIDHPDGRGKPWRCVNLATGETEPAPLASAAIERLSSDAQAPVAMSHRPELVGREGAVDCLLRAAKDAAAGASRVVLVAGKHGTGKTRLLTEAKDAAPGLELDCVLYAACSAERTSPLGPLRRAVAATEVGGVERAIAAVLDGDPWATVESVQASLERIAVAILEASRAQSILLCIDDVQWADTHTLSVLELLTSMAIEEAVGRVLLLATVRDEPRQSAALLRWIALVEREAGPVATRLVLGPLPAADARRVVRGVAPLAARVEDAVVRDAGGVPFWLVQPLLVWGDSGVLSWQPGGWDVVDTATLARPLPTASALVSASLATHFGAKSELARAAERVLGMVALAGSSLAPRILLEAAKELGLPPEQTEQAVDTLSGLGLLGFDSDLNEYRFDQETIRRAVLDLLGRQLWFPTVRRSVLDALAKLTPEPERTPVASFLAAGYESLGDFDLARPWLRRALEDGWRTGSFDDVVAFATRLAQMATSEGERDRAELQAIHGLLAAGWPRDAKARLDTARETFRTTAETDLDCRMLGMLVDYELGDFDAQADPLLVEDADRLGQLGFRVEARLARARCLRGHRGIALLEMALPLLRELPASERDLLDYRVHALLVELLHECSADVARCRAAAARTRDVVRRAGSLGRQLETDMNLAALDADAGEYEAALQALADVRNRADGPGVGSDLRVEVRVNLAVAEVRARRPEKAIPHALEAVTLARGAGRWRHLAQALSVLAAARLGTGSMVEAEKAIDEAVRLKQKGGEKRLAFTLLRRARIRKALGNRSGAEEDGRAALAAATTEADALSVLHARLWLVLEEFGPGAGGVRDEIVHLVESIAQLDHVHPDVKDLVTEACVLVPNLSFRCSAVAEVSSQRVTPT
jgi:eukaryotic-like serine/threonine-protein kinase